MQPLDYPLQRQKVRVKASTICTAPRSLKTVSGLRWKHISQRPQRTSGAMDGNGISLRSRIRAVVLVPTNMKGLRRLMLIRNPMRYGNG